MNLLDASNLIHEGIKAFARAEQQGIRVDIERANVNSEKLTKLITELSNDFRETKFFKHWQYSRGNTEVNIDSNFQLEHFLYKTKKIKPLKLTPSGKGSTDEEALQALKIPELSNLLRMRKLKKLRDTYLSGFISESVDGFIHPVFNLHTVSTYRSSSDSPNFQNIPVRDEEAKEIIRSCLFPRVGHQLLEVDFSGIEVCVAACYHKDPTMIEYIKNNYDMHGDMAKQIFFLKELDKSKPAMKTLRNGAKNGFVFPQFYGDYFGNNAVSLSDWGQLPLSGRYKEDDGIDLPSGITLGAHLIDNGIKSVDDFTDHLREIENHFWHERFPVYASWKKKWWAEYQKKGYFQMLTGFRCYGVMEKNDVINYPVQGSAFHCLLWSFIQIDRLIRKKGWQSRIIGQVHDSMIFDVYPPELEELKTIVARVTQKHLLNAWDWIIVPFKIEAELCQVDESWYHKKPINLE